MPVRYTPPTATSLLPIAGITLGATPARIKKWDRDDVLLVLAEPGTVAAGVFTQNRFCAAPVIVCREHLVREYSLGVGFRALIVNAGNANAGTGVPGVAHARQTCDAVASLVGCSPYEVLPYSTGVMATRADSTELAVAAASAIDGRAAERSSTARSSSRRSSP